MIDPHYCLNCASTGRADDGCGGWHYCPCLYGAELREMHKNVRRNAKPIFIPNMPPIDRVHTETKIGLDGKIRMTRITVFKDDGVNPWSDWVEKQEDAK